MGVRWGVALDPDWLVGGEGERLDRAGGQGFVRQEKPGRLESTEGIGGETAYGTRRVRIPPGKA